MAWQKYTLAFVITAAIFGTAFYIAQRIDAQRIADIRSTEENISIDILSAETQFELLGNLDCKTIAAKPRPLRRNKQLRIPPLSCRTKPRRQQQRSHTVKKQYSLLEIKDYLLLEQISTKCGFKPVYILYFYSNAGDCSRLLANGRRYFPTCAKHTQACACIRSTIILTFRQ